MLRTGELERGPAGVLVPGLLLTGALVVSFAFLASRTPYDDWGGLFIGVVLFAVTLPFLYRQAVREGDRRVFWLLAFALLVKLGGAAARNFLLIDLYGGVADAGRYHGWGIEIAESFRAGNFDPGLPDYTDTEFIRLFTGILYTVTGPTFMGGFVMYSWLAFLGMFGFYRAFTVAVPDGRARTYALLLFFLPSMVFWPSSIGKEAWMVFSLGIAASGAARTLSGRTWRGLLVAAVGLVLAGLVRPHVAGMVAVALAAAGLFLRPRVELRELAPVAKAIGLVAIAAVTVVVVLYTNRWLQGSGVETETGVTSALEEVSQRTSTGGSEFTPSAFTPLGAFTVLYRPLLFEATSVQSALAALETTFLLVLTVVRLPRIWAALRRFRRTPYLLFAAVFTAVFVVAFSAIANFGILARQRVQVLPFLLVLLSVPAVARRRPRRASRRVAA